MPHNYLLLRTYEANYKTVQCIFMISFLKTTITIIDITKGLKILLNNSNYIFGNIFYLNKYIYFRPFNECYSEYNRKMSNNGKFDFIYDYKKIHILNIIFTFSFKIINYYLSKIFKKIKFHKKNIHKWNKSLTLLITKYLTFH